MGGERGGRAARHVGGVRQQRTAARAGDAGGAATLPADASAAALGTADRNLLNRYVEAFEQYDIGLLTALLHEDAQQQMPPYELWLSGRDEILKWWFGPGIGCKGSKLVPTAANGEPAFGQYRKSPDGGYEAWSLQTFRTDGERVVEMTFFLDVGHVFPYFGLPLRLRG